MDMIGKRIQITALDMRVAFDGESLMPEGLDVGECGTVVGQMHYNDPQKDSDPAYIYITVDFDCGVRYSITGDDAFRFMASPTRRIIWKDI